MGLGFSLDEANFALAEPGKGSVPSSASTCSTGVKSGLTGIAGLRRHLATGPLDAVADRVEPKRATTMAAALAVPCLSRDKGHGTLLGAALVLVAVRAGLVAWSQDLWLVGLAQVMEGAAMGRAGAAIRALVAAYMDHSGHAGAGLGGVVMLCGAGVAVIPLVAGLVAQHSGFAAAVVTLGAVSAAGLALRVGGSAVLPRRAARAEVPDGAADRVAAQ